MIVKIPGTRKCDGTVDLWSNWMNVVKGASGDVGGVLSAFEGALLSIATSKCGTPIMHTMTGFCEDCIRKTRPRPRAIRISQVTGLGVSQFPRDLPTAKSRAIPQDHYSVERDYELPGNWRSIDPYRRRAE